jgi:hypothetical protein
MGRFLTNTLISDSAYFSKFKCFKAPLTVNETEAWKERHSCAQPMAPFEDQLFFVSKDENISFINSDAIESVTLNSNHEKDDRILRFIVHHALSIYLEDRGLQRCRNFYSHKRYMTTVTGRFDVSYNVFTGIAPIVFFRQGCCLITLKPEANIFTKVKSVEDLVGPEKFYLITLCDICPEGATCENVQHKISHYCKANKRRIHMVDITGKEFDCPSNVVRIESSPRTMKGEYGRILERTAPKTFQEYQFLSKIIDEVSEEGSFVLNLGIGITFSRLILRGNHVE